MAIQQIDNSAAEKVISSFNTNYFRRHDSKIRNKDKLIEIINSGLEKREPINFVMYWGKEDIKTPKMAERKALQYLEKFFSRFEENYPNGYNLTIIATDTHIKFNGYKDSQLYFDTLKKLTKNSNVEIKFMSEILGKEISETELNKKLESTVPNNDLSRDLLKSAEKHYKGDKTFEQAANLYFAMNLCEKEVVQNTFKNNVFLTYNSDKQSEILPEKMPIFFMQAVRGFADKPWFSNSREH